MSSPVVRVTGEFLPQIGRWYVAPCRTAWETVHRPELEPAAVHEYDNIVMAVYTNNKKLPQVSWTPWRVPSVPAHNLGWRRRPKVIKVRPSKGVGVLDGRPHPWASRHQSRGVPRLDIRTGQT